MPPKINLHRRKEEGEREKQERAKSQEIFEYLDRVYLKELKWYSSRGSKGEYNEQKNFWWIQLDKERLGGIQCVFIKYLTEEESICRNAQWQTYQEYMDDFLLDNHPYWLWATKDKMMDKNEFIKKYGIPNVVLYYKQWTNESTWKEYGEYIYTSRDLITKNNKNTLTQSQQESKKNIQKVFTDENITNTPF